MRPRAMAMLAGAALLALAAPAGTVDIPLPGPAPRAKLAAIPDMGLPTDARCARCHDEIAAEWRGSLHHRAWLNPYFMRSYALEPTPFCRKCHAPSADPAAEPPPEAREAGIGCTTCHVIPAGIVGSRGVARRPDAHEVIGDPRMATPAACGNCHDFAFPGPPDAPPAPMQDTLEEHKRSGHAATPCQGCHMPLVPSRAGPMHRSHGFRVQGDRAMMARAVVVKSAALSQGEVRLEIAPGAIGHAFPTGDLYRQVEVRAMRIDAAGRALGSAASVTLGRTFGPARHGSEMIPRVQRSDTRLVGPRTIALPVPPESKRARWQIVWQKMPPSLAARLGMPMADQETVVVEGVVSR